MRHVFAAGMMLFSSSVFAAPAALVQDVSDNVTSVQLLDFVSPGDAIDLGADGTVSLGYLDSCIQEEIAGGKVTIGATQSEVAGGNVSRETTQCDGARLTLAANESTQSGAMAFRDINEDTESQLTINDVSPVIVMPKGGKVTIKRLDVTGERYRIRTQGDGRQKVDLAAESIRLTPGARYMITAVGRSMVFDVAEGAGHDVANLMGRLIPL